MNNSNSNSFSMRTLKVVGIILPILLLLFLVGYVFKIVLFTLSAILIASFFRGIASYISDKTGLSVTWSLIATIIGFLIMVSALNWLLVPQVVTQAKNLANQLPDALQSAKDFLNQQWWGRQLTSQIPDDPQKFLSDHSGWALKTFGLVSSTFGVLADLYIIFLISLFIMFNPEPYVNGLVSLVPSGYQGRARDIVYNVYTILQRWLRGKLLSMLIVAALTAIGLYILGLPLVLFLSLLAGVLAFIPNFGPIISLIPAILVAIIQGPVTVLYILIIYALVQAVESNLITPIIQREMVYMPLAMTIIAQVVLGILIGGLGLILATPIVAVLMVLVRMIYIEDVLGQEVVEQK